MDIVIIIDVLLASIASLVVYYHAIYIDHLFTSLDKAIGGGDDVDHLDLLDGNLDFLKKIIVPYLVGMLFLSVTPILFFGFGSEIGYIYTSFILSIMTPGLVSLAVIYSRARKMLVAGTR